MDRFRCSDPHETLVRPSACFDLLHVIDHVNHRLRSLHHFLIIPSFLLLTWNSQGLVFLPLPVLLYNVTHTHKRACTASPLCTEVCGSPVKAVPDVGTGTGADMRKRCSLVRVIAAKTDITDISRQIHYRQAFLVEL